MERTLSDYAREKSTFVSIKPGEKYVCIYKGFKFVEKESFGEVKEYARYLLEDIEDGKTRNFDSMSGMLADRMDEVEVNKKITISRDGKGMKTKYKIVVEGEAVPDEENFDIPIEEEDENT